MGESPYVKPGLFVVYVSSPKTPARSDHARLFRAGPSVYRLRFYRTVKDREASSVYWRRLPDTRSKSLSVLEVRGIEPLTYCVQGNRSPS
jgi:hypothetical protein